LRTAVAALAVLIGFLLLYPFHLRAKAVLQKCCEFTLSARLRGRDLTLWRRRFTLKQGSLLRHLTRRLKRQRQDKSGQEVGPVQKVIRLLRVGRQIEIRSTLKLSTGDAAATAVVGGACGILCSRIEQWLQHVLPQDAAVRVGVKAACGAEPALKCSVECRGRFALAHTVWSYMRG